MPLSRPRLLIRLGAVAENYRTIRAAAPGIEVGAAVKADAYGLGVAEVATRLHAEGCRRFFVAGVEEGVELREVVPDAEIAVFNGVVPGTAADLVHHGLVPLVISGEQLESWRQAAAARDHPLPVGVHVDTGINRTGFPVAEAVALDDEAFAGLEVRHVLSHLASADEPSSPQPEEQLARFAAVRAALPRGYASLANSAGTFRSPAFHFDLVRPGIALYGGAPAPDRDVGLQPVVHLEAPILQLRDVEPGDKVGYGATYTVERPARHAAVPVGYADGFLRAASNRGSMTVAGHVAPIVGRVSMDLTIIDVTDVPRDAIDAGTVEVIGPTRTIDDVATDAGTISYEILTSLGTRYERVYEN